jgi:hypothetical protein
MQLIRALFVKLLSAQMNQFNVKIQVSIRQTVVFNQQLYNFIVLFYVGNVLLQRPQLQLLVDNAVSFNKKLLQYLRKVKL